MNNIDLWTRQLGVFPIILFPGQSFSDGQFIMLNGNENNFCIDNKNVFDNQKYRSYAWSSGVNNFLSISENKIILHRWFKQDPEVISLKTIMENLIRFYEYLGSGKGNKENTIVPFIIRIFRKLRNSIHESEGSNSLKALLYLLASMEHEKVDINKWGLAQESEEIIKSLKQEQWHKFFQELKVGIQSDNLFPEIQLILRHAAGRLFEEAHFEAFISPQLELFGPSPIIKYKSYNPTQYGAYFTPSYIARSIVEESLRNFESLPGTFTVFDPACGSGEFLIETLRQLKGNGFKGKVHLIGWDISESSIEITRFILTYELRNWLEGQITLELRQVDSISPDNKWPSDVDLLLMNPPFLSWELMRNKNLRERVKEILGQQYNKNPNLAATFLWLATQCLNNNGIIGCLLPSSIFNSDSHKTLRNSIRNIIEPIIIGRLGSFVFENALVDTCMLIASKTTQRHSITLLWTQNIPKITSEALRELRKQHYNLERIINEPKYYSIYLLPSYKITQENWMPVSYQSVKLKYRIESEVTIGKLKRVTELFGVHRGADPGREYFVISTGFYNSLSDLEKEYFRPCVDRSAIDNGKLQLINYLFYPKTKGLVPIESEEKLEKKLPQFYSEVLLPHKTELIKRSGFNENNWWHLQRHRPWQESKNPKIVSTAYGKAGHFAYDHTGEYVVERACAWILKDDYLNKNINLSYLAILNSDFFNHILAIYSKQLAGGEWYNLEPKYVNNIPIPFLTHPHYDNKLLNRLIDFGSKMMEGESFDRDELNRIVLSLFFIEE